MTRQDGVGLQSPGGDVGLGWERGRGSCSTEGRTVNGEKRGSEGAQGG